MTSCAAPRVACSPRTPARIAALGFYGLVISEEHGGAGLGHVEQCVIAEELGRALVDVPFLGGAMAAAALLDGPDREWLPKIAAGEVSAALVWDPRWVLDAELLGTRAHAGVPREAVATLDDSRARRASGDALQVFGGMGFTWEHPIHRYLKRARAQAVLLGPVADARDTIARHLGLG